MIIREKISRTVKSTHKLWDDTNISLTLSMYMVEEAKRFIEPDIDDSSEANTGEEENERNRILF